MTKPQNNHLRNGLTMIEMLIVMVVLGVLVVIGLFMFNDSRAGAEKTAMKTSVKASYAYAKSYAEQHEGYEPGMIVDGKLGDVEGVSYHTPSSLSSERVFVGAVCGDADIGTPEDNYIPEPASGEIHVCSGEGGENVYIIGSAGGQLYHIQEVGEEVASSL